MKNYFSKIKYWIFILFVLRMIGITNPPIEKSHNWRQSTGLMVSRNFLEIDANILYPRIDDNNGETGIIGMEFPSLNYLHFLVSKTFGYDHWYGRLINLIISSIGLLFFYKLICSSGLSERIAYFSTIFLLISIWFTFSRKMMPDTYCISLMFIGLYYGFNYLKEKKTYQAFFFVVISSLAILSKIPAGIYLTLLIPFIFNGKYKTKQKLILIFLSGVPLILTYIWYFKWNPKLSVKFGNWYNIGKPIEIGFTEIVENIEKVFYNFYFNAFSGYVVFSIFLVGLIFMFNKKEKKIMSIFILTFSAFLVYIFKSGFYFYHHNYYIIPFVPVLALVSGYAISLINKKWILTSLLAISVIESIANQQHDLFTNDSEKYKLTLESIMDQVSEKDDLILINGNMNPQLIYLSNRKGWNCTDEQLLDESFINEVINRNCKFIVINKNANLNVDNINPSLISCFENENFLILNAKQDN